MKTLVIVDDEMILQLIYKHLFLANPKFKDYEFVAFHSLESFLNALDNDPDLDVELLMLDLDLGPGLNGWNLFSQPQALKRLHKTRIYICTASILKEDKMKALAYKEVKGYFTKPITEEVIDIIAKEMML